MLCPCLKIRLSHERHSGITPNIELWKCRALLQLVELDQLHSHNVLISEPHDSKLSS
jgi:hypothetical protein